jgi:hypothetical protein
MPEHKLIVYRDKVISETTFVGFRNNYVFCRLTKLTLNFHTVHVEQQYICLLSFTLAQRVWTQLRHCRH